MNTQPCTDLLKNKLELHMNVHNSRVFMQDGAPCHQAKIVTQFLNSKKIQILDRPGGSPDPNPIANIWTDLKNKAFKRQRSNAKTLEQAITEVWVRVIATEYCQSLEESMPKRLEAVIKAKGGPTKY